MNQLYPTIKDLMLAGQFNWLGDDIRLSLWDQATVFNPAHTVIGDLAGTRQATSDPLPNRRIQDQMVQSDGIRFQGLVAPDTIHVAILHRDSDQRLIAFLDDVTGFDFTADGADYLLTPTGPNGAIFKL